MISPHATRCLALSVLLAGAPLALAGDGKAKIESPLLRPAAAPDADAEGRVRWETWAESERVRLRIQVKHVDAAQPHEAFLEDASETLVSIGLLASDKDDPDEMKLDLDTKKGEALPFGVATIDELIGRRVEVRVVSALPEPQTLLQGTIPAFVEKGPAQKAKSTFGPSAGSPSPGATGKVEVHSKPGKGDERLRIRAKGLPFDATDIQLFMEATPGAADWQLVDTLVEKSASKGEYRRRTKKGQALPFEAALADLVGRAFELRDSFGVVHMQGVVPTPQ